jgi:hypothetical protein
MALVRVRRFTLGVMVKSSVRMTLAVLRTGDKSPLY